MGSPQDEITGGTGGLAHLWHSGGKPDGILSKRSANRPRLPQMDRAAECFAVLAETAREDDCPHTSSYSHGDVPTAGDRCSDSHVLVAARATKSADDGWDRETPRSG